MLIAAENNKLFRVPGVLSLTKMLSPKAKMVAIPLVILALATGSVGGLLMGTQQIANRAEMVTIDIGVFWDVTCTQKCDFIDWGSLNPGENKTITVWVKNTGGGPITGSFNTSQWVPPLAGDYISLAWDFGDRPLEPGRVRETHLTIMVARDIHDVEEFYFLITVTGTQYIP